MMQRTERGIEMILAEIDETLADRDWGRSQAAAGMKRWKAGKEIGKDMDRS